jgi:hypothetical protein
MIEPVSEIISMEGSFMIDQKLSEMVELPSISPIFEQIE